MIDMADKTVEAVARAMHDAYENAARREGWETQEQCRVDFDDLPDSNRKTMFESAKAAISTHLKALEAEGMVIVPVEPTGAMIDAGVMADRGKTLEDRLRNEYRAMITAATEGK